MNQPLLIRDVIDHLESVAPNQYQESYDNVGLITGYLKTEVSKILVTLDCTEDVVQEAITSGANLIVAHHPIVFKGLKKFTGSNYVERVVILAIKNDIAIYAIHTSLDNVLDGVNRRICERIGLTNLKILQPKVGVLSKLVTFVPGEKAGVVLDALYLAGAGQIGNYKNCSFTSEGTGTFKPTQKANPSVGGTNIQEFVRESRIEVIFPTHLQSKITDALRRAHPYEEVAYYITPLLNDNQEVGSGMTGELIVPQEPLAFLEGLKYRMNVKVIRHTKVLDAPIKRVAVCGGAGSFLLVNAVNSGAQVFITSDFKYHEFFDADGKIIIADIGHYESEEFTKELLVDVLMKKFPTFAIIFSNTVTNPISYL
ncbi:MAG: Nif3-like dinuclear metal center hexameric protein [Chryseolinea sp.]